MRYLRWFKVTAYDVQQTTVFVEAYSLEEARAEARQHHQLRNTRWLFVTACSENVVKQELEK